VATIKELASPCGGTSTLDDIRLLSVQCDSPTRSANFYDFCRITHPLITADTGLPAGLQLLGKAGSDCALLEVALTIENIVSATCGARPDVVLPIARLHSCAGAVHVASLVDNATDSDTHIVHLTLVDRTPLGHYVQSLECQCEAEQCFILAH